MSVPRVPLRPLQLSAQRRYRAVRLTRFRCRARSNLLQRRAYFSGLLRDARGGHSRRLNVRLRVLFRLTQLGIASHAQRVNLPFRRREVKSKPRRARQRVARRRVASLQVNRVPFPLFEKRHGLRRGFPAHMHQLFLGQTGVSFGGFPRLEHTLEPSFRFVQPPIRLRAGLHDVRDGGGDGHRDGDGVVRDWVFVRDNRLPQVIRGTARPPPGHSVRGLFRFEKFPGAVFQVRFFFRGAPLVVSLVFLQTRQSAFVVTRNVRT